MSNPSRDCGHAPSPHNPFTTGTAHTSDGREICWDCAEREEKADLATARHHFAYLSGDGRTVTNWPGRILGTVTSETIRRVGFGYKATRTYLRVRMFDGSLWHGTSPGRGMYCRLYRNKVKVA